MLRKLFFVTLSFGVLACIGGALFATWGYYYITRDLPQMNRVEDYRPPVVSQVFAADGALIGEFYEERRYPVRIEDVPLFVRNAFLASEDVSFYSHPGIDLVSILRAFVKNLQTGTAKQGGSTITQQVVKNLLLTSQKKITRKIKEAILAYRIEQRLSKDDILQIYLNQIYFGNGAYGIKAAAKLYFHKELQELTVAEAAMLAGLPKAPSRYSPIANFALAKQRQQYVLDQMAKAGFISKVKADQAYDETLEVYRVNLDTLYAAPYYVSEVRRVFQESFPEIDLDRDGVQIHTPVDLKADALAKSIVQKGLRVVDKRRGWRGPIFSFDPPSGEKTLDTLYLERYQKYFPSRELISEMIYPVLVKQVNRSSRQLQVMIGDQEVAVQLKGSNWAKRRIDKKDRVTVRLPEASLKPGDVIEVSTVQGQDGVVRFQLDQSPELEGSLVLLDPTTGRVVTLLGGYSYQRSQFNRVTQALRQPGSAFKPVVYLAAIDGYQYTPASIVSDDKRTFKVGDEYWEPGNFDGSYLGEITLRTALEKSRNLVSADIISRIGVEAAIQYARKLGIKSKLGRNLSLSLGSSEVSALEIAGAYGVFANRGIRLPSVFIDKVIDRDGEIVFRYEDQKLADAEQVVSPESAFLIANMMKGVVQRGTGWRVREIERPVAGKTGTSNDFMDAWFVGYTPEWVCSVWVGFDVKRSIGENETGGKVAAPIWLSFMRDFLNARDAHKYQKLVEEVRREAESLGIDYEQPAPLEPLDFTPPEGVDPVWINKETGLLSSRDDPGAILEYFVKGTEPTRREVDSSGTSSYFDLPEL